VICENRQSCEDWESLVLIALEIGFRHLDPRDRRARAQLTHTEHHRELIDVVFKSKKSEAIADLLHAWTVRSSGGSVVQEYALLGICTRHFVGLHDLVPFSSRLRRLVIRSVELIGYKEFEGMGTERFIDLLGYLHVTVEDIDSEYQWTKLLLDALQSSEEAQHLSHWYWGLLVGLAAFVPPWPRGFLAYNPQITASLAEAQEWGKLGCWMGTVWMVWPPGAG